MPAEVFSPSLSDGFAIVHPESKAESYNSMGRRQQSGRADETRSAATSIGTVSGEAEKKGKDVDETPFASSSSTLTKRTRAVGS